MQPGRIARVSLCVLAAACARSPDRLPTATRYDSAGIRVVVTPADAGEEWRLGAAPSLDLADGPTSVHSFSRIRGILELQDGRIVVLDGGTCEIRYFSARAEPLHQVGRCGRQPGQFVSLWLVGRGPADELLVWDLETRRFTWLSTAGQPRAFVELPDSFGTVTPWYVFADSRVLATVRRTPAALRGAMQDTTVLWDLDPETRQQTRLVSKPGVWWWTGPRGREPVPFTGNAVFALRANAVAIAAGSEHAVELWSRAGTLQARYIDERPAEPLTRAEISEYRDTELRSMDAAAARDRLAEWNAMPLPAYRLAYDRLLISPDGRIWARDYEWRDQRDHRWTVFDTSGLAIARVRTPAFLEILELHEDHVLGHGTDENGREHAWVYAIDRPRAGQRNRP